MAAIEESGSDEKSLAEAVKKYNEVVGKARAGEVNFSSLPQGAQEEADSEEADSEEAG